jgi:hypothetical protein
MFMQQHRHHDHHYSHHYLAVAKPQPLFLITSAVHRTRHLVTDFLVQTRGFMDASAHRPQVTMLDAAHLTVMDDMRADFEAVSDSVAISSHDKSLTVTAQVGGAARVTAHWTPTKHYFDIKDSGVRVTYTGDAYVHTVPDSGGQRVFMPRVTVQCAFVGEGVRNALSILHAMNIMSYGGLWETSVAFVFMFDTRSVHYNSDLAYTHRSIMKCLDGAGFYNYFEGRAVLADSVVFVASTPRCIVPPPPPPPPPPHRSAQIIMP